MRWVLAIALATTVSSRAAEAQKGALRQRMATTLLEGKRRLQKRLVERKIAGTRRALAGIGLDAEAKVTVTTKQARRQIMASLIKEWRLLRRSGSPKALRRMREIEARYAIERDAYEIERLLVPDGAMAMAGAHEITAEAHDITSAMVPTMAHELQHVRDIPKGKRSGPDLETRGHRTGEIAAGRLGRRPGGHLMGGNLGDDTNYPKERIARAAIDGYLAGVKRALAGGKPLTPKAQAYLKGYRAVMEEQAASSLQDRVSEGELRLLWRKFRRSPPWKEQVRGFLQNLKLDVRDGLRQRLERIATVEDAERAGRDDATRMISPLGRAARLR